MNNIHTYKQLGMNIALDPCSGAVHVVDDETYALLETGKPPFDENTDAGLQLNSLIKAGQLFSEDDYQRFAGVTANAPIKALCLHVAHDCNLRCGYCFASTGDFGTEKRGLMSKATAKQAIDFLVENSGDRVELECDFFGGEPLMAWNTVTAAVDHARCLERTHGKHFRFTITTNGILLDDDKIDYINENMSNVVLSLDGRREVHDLMRPTANNKGSYDVVLPKFKRLVQKRNKLGFTDYYARGTFTKYNLDFANDVLAIADEGFKHISVEPVGCDESEPYAITRADMPLVLAEYDRLLSIIATRPDINFFHFNIDLDQGPCAVKRLRGCGAGSEYFAVTPEGDVYPCHRFVGIENHKAGNLTTGVKSAVKEYFGGTHIYSKENCPSCWARFYCSGGCNAASYLFRGDCKKQVDTDCSLMQKRTECGIALACKKALSHNDLSKS
ncbi:MAG: thioether cross-link-forming SCIFF peptide maturase [Oscillospiraceae bacterium]|jgi:uncharacterized protein|nr:thioether cross-link-forming SCIFF peptide maturase [Oscillospiraceae bacterium]